MAFDGSTAHTIPFLLPFAEIVGTAPGYPNVCGDSELGPLNIQMPVPKGWSAVITVIVRWTAGWRSRDTSPDCVRYLLNNLVVRTVEFTHLVSVHYVECSVLPTANQFVRKLSRDRENDSRACSQIQIAVVEEKTGGKVVEHVELLIGAREKFQVSVAVIPNGGIERPIACHGIDLIAQIRRKCEPILRQAGVL